MQMQAAVYRKPHEPLTIESVDVDQPGPREVLVRTVAMFELTFLTAGPDSQTLVVALYYAMFAPGVRTSQSVDAMAMVYMAVTLVWLLVALRYVNPTQLVSRVKDNPQPA